MTADQTELGLARRHVAKGETLSLATKELGPLALGKAVSVQNQAGPHKDK
jgi:hypothetical protein